MSQSVDWGKQIIKDAIRSTEAGEVARIPVADEANLAIFQQGLRAADVQRMVIQKGVSVEFYFPEPPVGQAKKHMLAVIESAEAQVEEIWFPVLAKDYADAEIALASNEVQSALQQRGAMTNPEKSIVHPADPGWDYYIEWHKLLRAKAQLDKLIEFISKCENATEDSQKALAEDISIITQTLESI